MKNLLFVALFLLCFTGIFSCDSAGKGPANDTATSKLKNEPGLVPLMDPRLATNSMQKWDTIRSLMVNTLKGIDAPKDTMYVAKGFHVPLNDLKRILNNIGDSTQLYAMLGIQYDSTQHPPAPYISLIFQAPDKSAEKVIRYYDFTRPCPTDCPNLPK